MSLEKRINLKRDRAAVFAVLIVYLLQESAESCKRRAVETTGLPSVLENLENSFQSLRTHGNERKGSNVLSK